MRPYPFETDARRMWGRSLLFGLFVLGFLALFAPFGLRALSITDLLWIAAGYGGVCMLIMGLASWGIPRLFPIIFREEGWTVRKEILWGLFITFCIGLGNYAFSLFMGFADWRISQLLLFEGFTLLVGVFPVTATVLLNEIRMLKQQRLRSEEVNGLLAQAHPPVPPPALIEYHLHLQGESPKDTLTLPSADLVLLSGADNYVEVQYLENGKLQRKLLRATLKSLREQLEAYPQFFSCHRRHIVNLAHVREAKGNAQGYVLFLHDTLEGVPVSRSLHKELLERIPQSAP